MGYRSDRRISDGAVEKRLPPTAPPATPSPAGSGPAPSPAGSRPATPAPAARPAPATPSPSPTEGLFGRLVGLGGIDNHRLLHHLSLRRCRDEDCLALVELLGVLLIGQVRVDLL